MAVQFNDATWSLPPSARTAVESTDPSHEADPEVDEAEVEQALEPWVEGPVPDGLVPPPDLMPLLEYPFIYHGGSGSKVPSRLVLMAGCVGAFTQIPRVVCLVSIRSLGSG